MQRNATRVLSRAPLRNDTLFSRKDTATRPAPDTWKLCAKRAAPAVSLLGRLFRSLLLPAALPLSAFHPRNLSRLCGGRAAESVPQRGIRRRTTRKRKEGGGRRRRKRRGGARLEDSQYYRFASIIRLRLHLRGRGSDAMKRSHGTMQRSAPERSRRAGRQGASVFALAALMALTGDRGGAAEMANAKPEDLIRGNERRKLRAEERGGETRE